MRANCYLEELGDDDLFGDRAALIVIVVDAGRQLDWVALDFLVGHLAQQV